MRPSRALKSLSVSVYTGSPVLTAVAATRRSRGEVRWLRPTARTRRRRGRRHAQHLRRTEAPPRSTRPTAVDPDAVAASSASFVACGPAASSAERDRRDSRLVGKPIGVDRRQDRSTTDVSSSPRVGSTIDRLIDARVEIGTERVASTPAPRSTGRDHERATNRPRGDRTQLAPRGTRLRVTVGVGRIAPLGGRPLSRSDSSRWLMIAVHGPIVALVAVRSN